LKFLVDTNHCPTFISLEYRAGYVDEENHVQWKNKDSVRQICFQHQALQKWYKTFIRCKDSGGSKDLLLGAEIKS
jgi:hypothetical protein